MAYKPLHLAKIDKQLTNTCHAIVSPLTLIRKFTEKSETF